MGIMQRDGFEEHVRRSIELYGFVAKRGGWPDFTILGQDGSFKMMVEVKGPNDHVSALQRHIHGILRDHGLDVRVVREADLEGLLAELDTLDRGAPPPPKPGPVTPDDVSEAISRLSYCDKTAPASASTGEPFSDDALTGEK